MSNISEEAPSRISSAGFQGPIRAEKRPEVLPVTKTRPLTAEDVRLMILAQELKNRPGQRIRI